MQFREVAWSQQLYYQRLMHGPGAEVTERSLPNYPGSAMREIIRQSEHPHNVEPLLLTLGRPANQVTRKRFAEVAGELVLIQKVTNPSPIATDFKMAVHGQIIDAPDGILYPNKDTTTKYEVWLRVEMLDVLRLMIEENLIRSLVPEMQLKLIEDMLQFANDSQQHELIRLYSFSVAYAAVKRFHAARAAAIQAGFLDKAAAFLATILDEQQQHPASSVNVDPFEKLKALTTSIQAMYLVAVVNQQGDYILAAAGAGQPDSNSSNKNSVSDLQRQVNLAAHKQLAVASLLVQAVEACWQLLHERDTFEYVAPSKGSNSSNGTNTAADSAEHNANTEKGETEKNGQLQKAAEEAVEAANMTFEENWQLFKQSVYRTDFVPAYAVAGIQLGCCLLQLLAHEVRGLRPAWHKSSIEVCLPHPGLIVYSCACLGCCMTANVQLSCSACSLLSVLLALACHASSTS
eukprot:GHRR01011001.1.p1 GENE.GHRR01011001.1~~GHRR01011001.1.p1  ORF type:complete len:461 (+),score=147.97 GHRR01011001.1:684-2066(+)